MEQAKTKRTQPSPTVAESVENIADLTDCSLIEQDFLNDAVTSEGCTYQEILDEYESVAPDRLSREELRLFGLDEVLDDFPTYNGARQKADFDQRIELEGYAQDRRREGADYETIGEELRILSDGKLGSKTTAHRYVNNSSIMPRRLVLLGEKALTTPITYEEVMNYAVAVDFSRSCHKPKEMHDILVEARDRISENENPDLDSLIERVEEIVRMDNQGLAEFLDSIVAPYMKNATRVEESCGVNGMGVTYTNFDAEDNCGLIMAKSRGKRGRNLLSKVGRKSRIQEKTARTVTAGLTGSYEVDHENQILKYYIPDVSAARLVFEGVDDAANMEELIYDRDDLIVVDSEQVSKPTYEATHLHVMDKKGFVRELQLMTFGVYLMQLDDGYHGDHKNDLELLKEY